MRSHLRWGWAVALLLLLSPTRARSGPGDAAHVLRGIVRDAQGPVAGVRVLATRSVAGESLSARPCVSGLPTVIEAVPPDCVDMQRVEDLVAWREGAVPVVAEVQSQADGAFALEGLDGGLYTLWAESPEGVGLLRDVALDTGPVELVLGPGSRLSGRVMGERQEPLAGARVTAVFAGHSRFFETLTDARGHYALGPLPRGAYLVIASHPDLSPSAEPVRLHPPEVWRSLTLFVPLRLSGRVVDTKGRPLSGAQVRLRGEAVHDTRSDARGRFTFAGLPFDIYELTASHGGLLALQKDVFPPEWDRSSHVREVTLTPREPFAEVEGVVRDGRGQPVAGARVQFADDLGCMGVGQILLTKTDARGRYRLGPLPPGHGLFRAFTVDQRLFQARAQAVPKGVRRTLDFTLQTQFLIEGQLVDGRELPVARGRVALFNATTRRLLAAQSLGADGRFSIQMPDAGPYLLSADADSFGQPRLQASAERVTAPARGLRPRLVLPFTVDGELLDDEARPVAGAWVSLWDEQDPARQAALARVTTDARGRFALVAPAPGRYTVGAEWDDTSFSLVSARTVEVGAEPVAVRLRFEAGQPLSGLVVDRRGTPLGGVSLAFQALRLSNRFGTSRAWVKTGPDGRFSFAHVAGAPAALRVDAWVGDERFHLAAFREEDSASLLRLAPSAREVRVVLVRTARLRGRFVRADGSPIPRFTVNGELTYDEEGRFEWPIEREGPLTLELAEAEADSPGVRETVSGQLEVDQDVGDVVADAP
ncbi:MSCRAMM family protein [Melittangium boletus]|uniref:MSCRAMM family protein n=1 Tax=Melittangium boletus TaxID=83453 RepID=UPI003DA4A983